MLTSPRRCATVLVVDHEPYGRELLLGMLRMSGYKSVAAHNDEAALQVIGHEAVDAVLIDASLPGRSAFRICRRIKRDRRTAPIAVLMMTAAGGVGEQVDAMEAGADDFLAKPVQRSMLIGQLHAYLCARRGRDDVSRICQLATRDIAALEHLEMSGDCGIGLQCAGVGG